MPLRFEQAIRGRLESKVPELLGVYGIPTGKSELSRPMPCAYVLYNGMTAESEEGDYISKMLVHWQIQIVVRNAHETKDGQSARSDAQSIINKVCATLNGWSPNAEMAYPLKLESSPPPIFIDGILAIAINFGTNYFIGE